jgi:hypothetical protein
MVLLVPIHNLQVLVDLVEEVMADLHRLEQIQEELELQALQDKVMMVDLVAGAVPLDPAVEAVLVLWELQIVQIQGVQEV